MISDDPEYAVEEEIHQLFRAQTKTLAACDFKKPTSMPLRIRASTYSCSRPFLKKTLVMDLEEMRNSLLSGYVGERKRVSFRCYRAGSPGYAVVSKRTFGDLSWQKETDQRGQRFYPATVMVDDDSEDFIRPVCNSIGSAQRPLRIKVIGCKSIDKSMIIKQIVTSEFNGLQDTTSKLRVFELMTYAIYLCVHHSIVILLLIFFAREEQFHHCSFESRWRRFHRRVGGSPVLQGIFFFLKCDYFKPTFIRDHCFFFVFFFG